MAAAATDKTVIASNAAEGAVGEDGTDAVPDGVDGVDVDDPVDGVNGTPPQTPLPHITVPVMVIGLGIDGASKVCESASHPFTEHVPPPP